jgi:LuxR family maltose regulon positive regulatory protein
MGMRRLWCMADPAVSPSPAPLTAREREVLDHVTRPHGSRAEAAKALGISPHTVKSHLASIYTKLGVNSPAQAIRVLDLARTG